MDITSKPPGTVGESSSFTLNPIPSRTDARCDGKQNGYRDLERTRLLYFYLLLSESLSVSFASRYESERGNEALHNRRGGQWAGKKGISWITTNEGVIRRGHARQREIDDRLQIDETRA